MGESFNKLFKVKLLFALVFSIPLIVWIVLLSIYISNVIIINSGEQTIACIVSEPTTNVSVNGIPQYKFEYMFEVDGEQYYGETGSHYTWTECEKMEKTGLSIYYDPETLKSTPADYKDKDHTVLYVLPIFGVIAIVLFISIIKDIRYSHLARACATNGTITTGTYVSSSKGFMVNQEEYFSIKYTYTTDSGKTKQFTTKSTFTYTEQLYYKQKGNFQIKYYGDFSTIIEDVDFLQINFSDKNSIAARKKELIKKCQYCGSILNDEENTCSHCGAIEFTYIEKKVKKN